MSYSVGVKKKIPDKASQDASVVKMVREAGAIILLVSNTPELCLFWESNNKVTGPTRNPYDTTKVSGGSSGGEVCILPFQGSLQFYVLFIKKIDYRIPFSGCSFRLRWVHSEPFVGHRRLGKTSGYVLRNFWSQTFSL